MKEKAQIEIILSTLVDKATLRQEADLDPPLKEALKALAAIEQNRMEIDSYAFGNSGDPKGDGIKQLVENEERYAFIYNENVQALIDSLRGRNQEALLLQLEGIKINTRAHPIVGFHKKATVATQGPGLRTYRRSQVANPHHATHKKGVELELLQAEHFGDEAHFKSSKSSTLYVCLDRNQVVVTANKNHAIKDKNYLLILKGDKLILEDSSGHQEEISEKLGSKYKKELKDEIEKNPDMNLNQGKSLYKSLCKALKLEEGCQLMLSQNKNYPKKYHDYLFIVDNDKVFLERIEGDRKEISAQLSTAFKQQLEEQIQNLEKQGIIPLEQIDKEVLNQLGIETESVYLRDHTPTANHAPQYIKLPEEVASAIFTKLRSPQKARFSNEESWAILSQLNPEYRLKYELNNFGNKPQVLASLAEDGEAYNLGLIKTSVDNTLSFKPNGFTSPSSHRPLMDLKDTVLEHKHGVLADLIAELETLPLVYLSLPKQLEAQYPCLVMGFKRIPGVEGEGIDLVEEAIPPGYAEFMTHLMIAHINIALQQAGCYPLIDRRQSLGFLTPTLTELNTGLRLSLGLAPNKAWEAAVIQGIEHTETALKAFKFTSGSVEAKLLDSFRGGELSGDGYLYLEHLYQSKGGVVDGQDLKACIEQIGKPQSVLVLGEAKDAQLRKQAASLKNGSTLYWWNEGKLLAYSKEPLPDEALAKEKEPVGLKDEARSSMGKKPPKDEGVVRVQELKINDPAYLAYFLEKHWEIQEGQIKLDSYQEAWLQRALQHEKSKPQAVTEDYQKIYNVHQHIYQKIDGLNPYLIEDSSHVDLEAATLALVHHQGAVIEHLMGNNPVLVLDDTSDEEDEEEALHRSNYYTPSGMSALAASLYAAKVLQKDHRLPITYGADPYAYFELNLSWNKTLDEEHFIRYDLVDRSNENRAFKVLLDTLVLDGKISSSEMTLLFETSGLYKELLKIKAEGQELDLKKLVEQALNGGKLLDALQANPKPGVLKGEEAQKVKELLEEGAQMMYDSFHDYVNTEQLARLRSPMVFYVDNNPCVTGKHPFKSALTLLREQVQKNPCPQVFVLDTTSSTQQQVQAFLKEFHQQDRIPLLVTATSTVKHHELGLDLFQGGANKIYLSKQCPAFFESYKQFTAAFKQLTRGSESGLARRSRRSFRQAYAEVLGKEESLVSMAKSRSFKGVASQEPQSLASRPTGFSSFQGSPLGSEGSSKKKRDTHWYRDHEIKALLEDFVTAHPQVEAFTAINADDLSDAASKEAYERYKLYSSMADEALDEGDSEYAQFAIEQAKQAYEQYQTVQAEEALAGNRIYGGVQEVLQGWLANKKENVTQGVLPLRIHGNHWVGLHLNLEQADAPVLTYIDPLGYPLSQEIKNTLQAVFPNLLEEHLHVSDIPHQKDGYNCGPWVVECLNYLVLHHGNLPPQDFIPDIQQQRLVQQALLTQEPQALLPPSKTSAEVDTSEIFLNFKNRYQNTVREERKKAADTDHTLEEDHQTNNQTNNGYD